MAGGRKWDLLHIAHGIEYVIININVGYLLLQEHSSQLLDTV